MGVPQPRVAPADPVATPACPENMSCSLLVRDSCLFYPDPNLNNLDSCSQLGGTLNGRK